MCGLISWFRPNHRVLFPYDLRSGATAYGVGEHSPRDELSTIRD
jgi:hypothetical protein